MKAAFKGTRSVLLCLFLMSGLLLWTGCGGGGGGGDSSGGGPIVPQGTAGAVYITTPSEEWITTTSAAYNVKGRSTGTLPVTWSNSTGDSGTAAGTTEWETGNVTLTPGDNLITVSGGSSQTDAVHITYNPTVDFRSAPTLSAAMVAADTVATVYVTIAIDYDNLDSATVALYEYDSSGIKGTKLGDMKDDGDFSGISGDDVIGDNIYTLKITIDEPEFTVNHYRVFANDDFGGEAASAVAKLYVVAPPTEEMVQNAEAYAKDIEDEWNFIAPALDIQAVTHDLYRATFSSAQDELVSYIGSLPNNLFVYKGTNGVFYAMNDAPFIMIQETISALDEYENQIDGAEFRGPPAELTDTVQPAYFAPPPATDLFRAAALDTEDEKNTIKDKKALYIAPYYWQHVHSTKMTDDNGGWTKIEESTCPDLEETEVLNGTDESPNEDPKTKDTAIIDAFTTLSNYGTILIHTHGAYWNYHQSNWVTEIQNKINVLPNGTVKSMLQTWLNNQKSSVLSWTGKKLLYASDVYMDIDYTSVLNHKYWMDFMTGSLYLANSGKIFIPPAFIDKHNGNFPNSVIWSGACHSLEDESMSSVFIAKGAGAYFGFDSSVYRHWNVSRSGVVFEKMLSEGKTAKEAFDDVVAAGNDDGQGAKLVFKGNNDLRYDSGLQNPSFEAPDGAGSLESWTVTGDGRAWHAFQDDLPTDGTTMAVVSSGLGHTTSYGDITQNFCLPADAGSLSFDWNFYSAEFKDYCNSKYDDTFQATINGTPVFTTSVNILCGDADKLIETQPIDDKGDCFKTGWKTATVPITAYAGEDIILTFKVLDKGDTIYDTAVLIDNIQILTP